MNKVAPPRIYDFNDYRTYVRAWIESSPKPRGQLSRISEAAGIHKATLSQILGGTKDFSLEQAHRAAAYLSCNSDETEFFLLLVNLARAGSSELRTTYKRQVERRKKEQSQLAQRVTKSRDLGPEERGIYYSNWIYSAVRNLSAIERYNTVPEIAARLGLERSFVAGVVEFLLKTGLCLRNSGGIRPGPQMTHLESISPIVARHHGNWRIKAMERHPVLNAENELAYSAPMTLSEKDAHRIRDLLAHLVQKTDEIVVPSPSERLYCMCLDWFEVR